ncbi:MAG: hypothetical protein LBM92_01810, partial [Opitutaceae bacterium]|nr:hypothetical protein [Opitutaceae bacterium]
MPPLRRILKLNNPSFFFFVSFVTFCSIPLFGIAHWVLIMNRLNSKGVLSCSPGLPKRSKGYPGYPNNKDIQPQGGCVGLAGHNPVGVELIMDQIPR